MKYVVLADVHGNLPALERVLAERGSLDVDRLVFLGDAIGYNGFPEECVARIREHAFQAIKGNHEALLLGELPFSTCTNPIAPHTLNVSRGLLGAPAVAYLKSLPGQAVLHDRALLVHGSVRSIYEYLNREDRIRASFEALRESGKRIAFFAHTHRPAVYATGLEVGEIESIPTSERLTLREDRYYLINPGTAGEPRRGRALSFLVYDLDRSEIEFTFFELSPAEHERLRRRNREVFGSLEVVRTVNRGIGFGRRMARKIRHGIMRLSS